MPTGMAADVLQAGRGPVDIPVENFGDISVDERPQRRTASWTTPHEVIDSELLVPYASAAPRHQAFGFEILVI